MLETFWQSWFFFTRNYRLLGVATLALSLLHWWLVPDAVYSNVKIEDSADVTQLVNELDLAGMMLFILVTEILGLLFFTNLFRVIVLSPEMGAYRLLLSAVSRFLSTSVTLILVLLLVSLVAGMALVPLWFFSGTIGSFVQIVLTGLFLYISLKLAFLFQAIVHDDKIRPIACLKKSFELTKNRLSRIMIVFFCTLLATGTVGAMMDFVSAGDPPNSLLMLVESLLHCHIRVFSWILIYRLFLDALRQSDAEAA